MAAYRSRFDEILAVAEARAEMVVAKAAADIEAGAKTRARVDTGAMKNGWQTRGTRLEREVFNPVHYAVFHEFGTRHMSAQPMVIPALEEARPGFLAALRQVFK